MEKQEAQEQGETQTNKEDNNNDGQQLKDSIQNDENQNKQKSEQSSSPQMISNINDSEYKRELYKIYNEESNNVSEYTQDQIKKIDSHILKNISNEDNNEQFKKQISHGEENIGEQYENLQNQNNQQNQEQNDDSKQDQELQGKIQEQQEQNTLKQNQYSNNIIGLNKQESLDISPIKPPSTQKILKNQKNLNMNMNLIKNCSGDPDESSTPQQIMQQLKSQLSQEGTINQKFLDNFTYSQSNENRLSEQRDSETQQIEQSQGNKIQNISEFSKLKQKSQSSKSDQNNSDKKSQNIEQSQNFAKKKSYSNENKHEFPGNSLNEEKYKDISEQKIDSEKINDSQEIENQRQDDKQSDSDQQVQELKEENKQQETLQFTKSNQISRNKIKDQNNLINQKQVPDLETQNTFEQNEQNRQNQIEQENENGDLTEKLQIQIQSDNENQQQQEKQIKLKLDENQKEQEQENEKASKNYYINEDEQEEEEQKNEYNYGNQENQDNEENDEEFEKISIKNKKKSQWTVGNITNNIALLISQDFQYLYIPICFLPDDLNQGDEIKLEAFKINQKKESQQLQELKQLQNQILNDPGFFGEQM